MLKHSRWMLLAMAGVLLSTADADAFGRKRRGCNGGGGCHGGGSSCHGGGGYYGGCHGGGRVIHNGHGGCHSSGCHGGGTVYYGGQPMYSGGVYSTPRDTNYEQGGERLPQPRRDDFNESDAETGQIIFRAPQGAQVWVDGQLVERRGDNWVWTSPSLSGRRSFEVKARWNEDGRVVNRSRMVNIQSGGRTTLDFNRAEGSEIIPATGESDRNRDLNRNDLPRSNTTPNTAPRPQSNDTQPRPGASDLEPRNPATPRTTNPPATPNSQPRPQDR